MKRPLELPRGTKRARTEKAPKAEWMSDDDIAAFAYRDGAVLLGKYDDRLIGIEDDRHLLTVAGSRSGKSSTCLKPNLRVWPSSILCIDPKGELAMDTALHRASMGQDVYILDPFEEVKGEAARFRAGFNPLSEMRHGKPQDTVDDVSLIAEALIVPNKNDTSDHWTMSAKNLLRGLMLHLIDVKGHEATLPMLRDLVTLPLEGDGTKTDTATLETVFGRMMKTDAFGGTVAGVGGTMKGKPDGERGSVISTAVEQTAFLDSEPMQSHLGGGGSLETLRQLKRKPTTIYLVLPASRMATHFRWLRVMLTLALAAMEREPTQLSHPVLFILEEFPQLGYMRQIEAAAGLMAGYGVKLWTVLQDLPQIKALYRDSWETFIGNAGVVQAFGNTDATTLEYISRALGTRQIAEQVQSTATPTTVVSASAMERENYRSVPLLAPFEVAQYCARDTQRQILMIAGRPPAYINRMTHKEVSSLDQ